MTVKEKEDRMLFLVILESLLPSNKGESIVFYSNIIGSFWCK